MKYLSTFCRIALLIGCVASTSFCADPYSAPEVHTEYTGEQFLQWENRTVDNVFCRISPVITYGVQWEMNHHYVQVDYTGTGQVRVALVHSSSNRLDIALKRKFFRSRFMAARSGKEVRIVSRYRQDRYAWLLIETKGTVRITRIRHRCWRGKGTAYGHMASNFKFQGKNLRFRIKLPRNYNPSKSYPLVISVHGSGGIGDDNYRNMEEGILARYLFTKYYLTDEFNCFSVVPQIPKTNDIPKPYFPQGPQGAPDQFHPDWPTVNENGWYTQATIALVKSLLKSPAFNVDPDRVYFTGYSYGGKACWEALRAGRELFAAGISAAGWSIGTAYSTPNSVMRHRLKLEVQRIKHIPVAIYVGGKDNMKYSSRAIHEEFLAQGGKSTFVEFPGASHGTTPDNAWANRNHLKWLFSQNRKNNPACPPDPYPGGKYRQPSR